MSGATERPGRGLSWLMGAAIIAVVGAMVFCLLPLDENEAADHFLQVVRAAAPRQRTVELPCEEGSFAPQMWLRRDPTVVRSRLERSGWRRMENGVYRRRFDGWTGELALSTRGDIGAAITVTEDDGLDCGDLLRALRGHEFRVRRT